jgi:hypothetical protein
VNARDALVEVQQALARLDAAGTARITSTLGSPVSGGAPRTLRERIRREGLGWVALFAAFRAADSVLRVGRRKPAGDAWSLGSAVGVVDLVQHRACVDYGAFAILEKDDQEWRGASGSPLEAILHKPHSSALQPLWLIDLLRGAHSASRESSNGDVASYSVTVDLAAAVSAAGRDLALPGGGTYRSLELLPLTVELRGADLASIRFTSSSADFAIDFIDAGKPLAVDWNRLPRFKDERDRVIPDFGLARG